MIVGTGIDVAEVGRLEQATARHGQRFLERVFTAREIEYCERHKNRFERYAARFAAKEAGMKALGVGWRGGVRWRDLEVVNQRGGGRSCGFREWPRASPRSRRCATSPYRSPTPRRRPWPR